METIITEATFPFFYLGFISRTFRIQGHQVKGEAISLTLLYHFHRPLDIYRAITADSSPLHIASSRTRTGNIWFPSASRWPLSYVENNHCFRENLKFWTLINGKESLFWYHLTTQFTLKIKLLTSHSLITNYAILKIS